MHFANYTALFTTLIANISFFNWKFETFFFCRGWNCF